MANKHTLGELQQMQSLSLESKIQMTRTRIKAWVQEYGEDGVYVSFSGGKDSTVLLHIVREMYPDIPAVFVNTGLEFPEIVKFVKTFDNVEIIRPKLSFRQVIEKYGYPFISKEVSECVYGARKYLTSILAEMDASTNERTNERTNAIPLPIRQAHGNRRIPYTHEWQKLTATGKFGKPSRNVREIGRGGGKDSKFAKATGILTADRTIEPKLWKNYRQFASPEANGNQQDGRESNSGDYP